MGDENTAGEFHRLAVTSTTANLPVAAAAWVGLWAVVLGARAIGVSLTVGSLGDFPLVGLVYFFAVYVVHAFVSHGVLAGLRDERTSLGESARTAFSSIHLVLGAAALVGVANLLIGLPLWAVNAWSDPMSAPYIDLAGRAATLLGGFVVNTTFCLAIPVIADGRDSPVEALKRSRDLTSGHRLSIAGAFIFLGLVWTAASWAAVAALGGPATRGGAMYAGQIDLIWEAGMMALVSLFFCYFAVLNTAIYDRLRRRES